MHKIIIISLLLTALVGITVARSTINLSSPDKKIIVHITLKNKLEPYPHGERIYYSITFKKQLIMADSPIGIKFKEQTPFDTDLIIVDKESRNYDRPWRRVWGKRKNVSNNYNELKLHLQESAILQRKINLIFRAYNDGIAIRYQIPEQTNIKEFQLTSERIWFNINKNATVWAANYGGFVSHQESEFSKRSMADLNTSEVYGCPLLIDAGEAWMAITEANLTDWAGMYLTKAGNSANALVTSLSPRLDIQDALVISTAPRLSPWRVIMIGESPGDLIESDIISNLNDPCTIKDTSWIIPGKSAWDWWWSARYAPDVDFEVGSNTETMKYFIDFASDMDWEYQLVDWHWYGRPFITWDPVPTPDPEGDITTQNPKINIAELVQYAKGKNVRLLIWLEWSHADKQMDEAFPLYEKWGVAGVKVDFMQRDDQEMVNYYHQLIKKAAEHKLLVDFHGAYKPTGFSRTYPNVITREGVLGNEYTKWSSRITPEHNVTLPFTRGLLGEMDYTPGAFVQTTKDNFRTEEDGSSPMPMVMGTRCHQLAMMVVFESALQVMCDSPYNYRQKPAGLDFLKIVPTTWLETKVINASVGKYVTIARQAENGDWFIGSMTDWNARSLPIALDFLADGKYTATIWEDADDADKVPDHLNKRKTEVDKTSVIDANLAPGGGHVVHIRTK